jgi:hypothetical protein
LADFDRSAACGPDASCKRELSVKKYSARMVGKFPRALIEQIGSFNAVRDGSSKNVKHVTSAGQLWRYRCRAKDCKKANPCERSEWPIGGLDL